jgi:hypothetical protein
MVERGIGERFCMCWWEDEGTDWKQHLACLLGWPVPIAIENTEILDGGGA